MGEMKTGKIGHKRTPKSDIDPLPFILSKNKSLKGQ
jgi:hypothetical protein